MRSFLEFKAVARVLVQLPADGRLFDKLRSKGLQCADPRSSLETFVAEASDDGIPAVLHDRGPSARTVLLAISGRIR